MSQSDNVANLLHLVKVRSQSLLSQRKVKSRFYMNSVKSCKNVKDRPKEHNAMYDSDVVGDPDNLFHLLNDVFLVGDEPTVEDLLLILGTLVGFIAFVLWCCFPVTPYLKCAENERNDEKVNKVFKEYQRELVGKKKFDGYQNFCF